MSNEWFERGEFPPVGSHVEYMDSDGKDYIPVFIVAAHHFDKAAVIFSEQSDSGSLFYGYAHEFRPIKTEKEKAIEAAIEAMQPNSLTGTMALWFGKLYDSGLLRLPEDKK